MVLTSVIYGFRGEEGPVLKWCSFCAVDINEKVILKKGFLVFLLSDCFFDLTKPTFNCHAF